MTENKKILEEWRKQISCFPKLTFETAKDLYLDMQSEVNREKKNKIRDNLIKGTLYVVVNFIERSQLSFFNSVSFDMNDIINACNEIWIELIDSGIAIDKNRFGSGLNRLFYLRLTNKLLSSKLEISENTVLTTHNIHEVLYQYIKLKEVKGCVSYKGFIELLKSLNISLCSYPLSSSSELVYTYQLFEAISKEIENEDISKTKIDNIKYLLLEMGLENLRIDIEEVYVTDFVNDLILKSNDLAFKEAIENSDRLSEREKGIIANRYGFIDGKVKTLEEVSQIYGVTPARISFLENKALRKLRRPSSNMKQYIY